MKAAIDQIRGKLQRRHPRARLKGPVAGQRASGGRTSADLRGGGLTGVRGDSVPALIAGRFGGLRAGADGGSVRAWHR